MVKDNEFVFTMQNGETNIKFKIKSILILKSLEGCHLIFCGN